MRRFTDPIPTARTRLLRQWRLAAAVLAAALLGLAGGARATVDASGTLGVYPARIGEQRLPVTYQQAKARYGPPSWVGRATVTGCGGFRTVAWRAKGVRLHFSSGAGHQADDILTMDGSVSSFRALAVSRSWRTPEGARPGDSVTRLRRLYPVARPRARATAPGSTGCAARGTASTWRWPPAWSGAGSARSRSSTRTASTASFPATRLLPECEPGW